MTDTPEAFGTFGALGLDPMSMVALAAIVIIGLPHGAFDGAVALALGYGKTLRSMFRFIVAYIVIAACVVVFWMVFPTVALLLFLLISMVHFGLGDSQRGGWVQRSIQTLAHGGLVVIAISSVSHRAEVDPIFAHLLVDDTTVLWMVLSGAAYGLAVIVACYAVLAFQSPVLRPETGRACSSGGSLLRFATLGGVCALFLCSAFHAPYGAYLARVAYRRGRGTFYVTTGLCL